MSKGDQTFKPKISTNLTKRPYSFTSKDKHELLAYLYSHAGVDYSVSSSLL